MDNAGADKNNRHSISGYVLFLMNVPILWKSKMQRIVSLSSSEAEYYALAEAVKDIKFIVHVDNVGAIFMTENVSATPA